MEAASVLLTISEVAERFRIHPNTAYLIAKQGAFKGAFKLNKEWRIPLAGVEEYIATSAARVASGHRAGNPPAPPNGDRAAARPGDASTS